MSRTLGIVSSTAVVGVALADGDTVVAHRQLATDRRHAEELTPLVAELLAEAGWRAIDLDRFAVDVGPGRFTGLRVGLATVRALAFAADAPVVGVTSLELLASAADLPAGRPVAAVVDARRNEVFQQRFLDGRALDAPAVGPATSLVEAVEPGDLCVGDGADRYPEVYGSEVYGSEVYGSEVYGEIGILTGREPSCVTLVSLAADREGAPGSSVEPVYLRDADVQINIKTRHS